MAKGETWIDVPIDITCESCGHQYQASSRVSASKRPLDGLPFFQNREQRLTKKLERIYSGDYRALDLMLCPECRYTQSWNIVGAQRNLAQLISGGAGFLVGVGLLIYWMATWEGGVLGKVLDSACLGLLVGAGVGGLVYVVARQAVRLYNPNGRKRVENTLSPTITRADSEPSE